MLQLNLNLRTKRTPWACCAYGCKNIIYETRRFLRKTTYEFHGSWHHMICMDRLVREEYIEHIRNALYTPSPLFRPKDPKP